MRRTLEMPVTMFYLLSLNVSNIALLLDMPFRCATLTIPLLFPSMDLTTPLVGTLFILLWFHSSGKVRHHINILMSLTIICLTYA